MTKEHDDNDVDSSESESTASSSTVQEMMMKRSSWNETSVKASVERWELNEKEMQKLLDLEQHISDIQHEKNCPAEAVRFLRETHGNVKEAERMFRKYIHWRVQNGVDTILEDYHPDPILQEFCPMTMLEAYDKEGDAIWYEFFGAADAVGLYRRFGRQEIAKYFLWVQELAAKGPFGQKYATTMKRPPRVTCIIDLKGLNRGHMRPGMIPIYEDVIDVIQNYYCGYVKKIIFIREPAIFRVGWSVAKHFFNHNMRALMVFAGSDYQQVLKEYIQDLEQDLPSCLIENGKGLAAAGMPQHLEGGRLPPEARKCLVPTRERNSHDSLPRLVQVETPSMGMESGDTYSVVSSLSGSSNSSFYSATSTSDHHHKVSNHLKRNNHNHSNKKTTLTKLEPTTSVSVRGERLGGGTF